MDIQAFRGIREGPIGGRVVVAAVLGVVAALLVVAFAMALAGPRPPGSILTGATWQWIWATADSADAPLVVADPSKYTIEFVSASTFRATADCITVSGTYVSIPPGRTGLSSSGLRLRPDPYSPASCVPYSLSNIDMDALSSASSYVIADATLTISRAPRGTMIFEVEDPAASAPSGAQV
jgi:hypothetical protein